MVDEFVGKYRILRKLGAGGMASVYLASHRDVPNLRTVLKELSDPRLADRFRREADKLALLDGHSGICQIKHFFDHEGQFYIVMEYIDGPTLDDLIRSDNPPDIDRSVELARSILGTLEFAHQQGVIHRDIKPTNIMLDRMGQVKIIDFGIAKGAADPDLTQVGASLGSPRYMAPEQFNAVGTIDWVRCDVYAVGVTLYYLLTRDFPFRGSNIYEICEAKRVGAITPPSRLNPAISPALDTIVLKSMARDPADRYASAAEMRAALLGVGSVADPTAVVGQDQTLVLGLTPPPATLPPPAATPPPAPPPTPTPTPLPPAAASPPTAPAPEFARRTGARRRIALAGGALAVIAVAIILVLTQSPSAPPDPPVPRQPGMDAVLTDPVVEFAWEHSRGLDLPATLEIAADPGFAAPQAHPGILGGRFERTLDDGAYVWRVRATPPGEAAGAWSPVGRFRVERPPAPTAALIVIIEPEGSELIVDGESRGTVQRVTRLTLAPGPHNIVARRPGTREKEISRDVTLQPGEEVTLEPPIRFQPTATSSPTPTPAPARPVPVTVMAMKDGESVIGALIAIDGKTLEDQTTPYRVELSPGSHEVIVSLEVDGTTWTGRSTMVVKAGMAVQRLQIPLAPPR